jgi:hypothetical protein
MACVMMQPKISGLGWWLKTSNRSQAKSNRVEASWGTFFCFFVRNIERGMRSKSRTTAEFFDTTTVFGANANLSSAALQCVADIQQRFCVFV